ncbi:MAG TPA: adenylate/guanylate cyclase domain-containing protein [Kofleriaceae bacterium]
MSAKQPTKGTEIAALEAQRNEQQVLAEGALVGERRVAIARLAMVAMFGIISNVRAGGSSTPMSISGAIYTFIAIVTVIMVHRVKIAEVGKARVRPLILSAIDWTFITGQGLFAVDHGSHHAGMAAVASAVVLSFAVARWPLVNVVFSIVCAPVSFAIVSAYDGTLGSHPSVFMMGGLLVLGFMILLTNLAVRRMFAGLRQRDNLTRFLPRQVAERVMQQGPGALAPVERIVTVLFSDIRGFTSMSEGLSPREVLIMLDDYFGRMSQIVKGHDGVVGKFMGDGLLAYWGVPDKLDDHAVMAVRAARDMRKAVRELNQHRETQGLPPIKIGIGIHTGTVAAGMLGGSLQSEYTVIGDAVNVASRVEGLTKEYDVDVLISETTWQLLGEPRRGDKLGSAEIRGRKEPVVLYTIDSSSATVEIAAQPEGNNSLPP